MKNYNKVLGAIALTVGSLWGGSAFAVDPCPGSTSTVAAYIGLGSCQNEDKVWSQFSVNSYNPPTNPIYTNPIPTTAEMFINTQQVGFDDHHRLNLANTGNTAFTPGTYQFRYALQVEPIGGLFFINEAFQGINQNVGTASVSLNFFNYDPVSDPGVRGSFIGNLTALTNSQSVSFGFNPSVKAVWVEQTLVVNSGLVNSVTTTYVEQGRRVPEPESLMLFGIGLIGLVAAGKRRKA